MPTLVFFNSSQIYCWEVDILFYNVFKALIATIITDRHVHNFFKSILTILQQGQHLFHIVFSMHLSNVTTAMTRIK